MVDYWLKRIHQNTEVINTIAKDEELLDKLNHVAEAIVGAYQSGSKLMLCGNGGSAADSQHLAAELVSRFYKERRALDAEALTVNASVLTAIGNDYSYDNVFERQVEAKGAAGDVLIGISTSGNSKNVIRALEKANTLGILTVGLTGENHSAKIGEVTKFCIFVPSAITPRIQEAHILIGHMICEYIEEKLFGA